MLDQVGILSQLSISLLTMFSLYFIVFLIKGVPLKEIKRTIFEPIGYGLFLFIITFSFSFMISSSIENAKKEEVGVIVKEVIKTEEKKSIEQKVVKVEDFNTWLTYTLKGTFLTEETEDFDMCLKFALKEVSVKDFNDCLNFTSKKVTVKDFSESLKYKFTKNSAEKIEYVTDMKGNPISVKELGVKSVTTFATKQCVALATIFVVGLTVVLAIVGVSLKLKIVLTAQDIKDELEKENNSRKVETK